MPTPFVPSSVYSFLLSLYWLYCHNGAACGAFLLVWVFAILLRECLGRLADVSELKRLYVTVMRDGNALVVSSLEEAD